MSLRNITLTLPAELIRKAKIAAARRDTSVSGLVAGLLTALPENDDYEELWDREQRLMEDGLPMSVGPINWSRTDSHAR